MTREQIIDAEVIDDDDAADAAAQSAADARIDEQHATGTSVARVPVQPSEVLRPIASAADVRDAMREYQDAVRAVLDDSDWQGIPNGRGSFVKKSGWRKIAKAYGLSIEIVKQIVERDDDGNPVRAEVWVRAIAPNGQYQDADGYCSADESRFAQAKGRQKLENDLRATATTRAKNRAISDVVGMGEVSAEEVSPLEQRETWRSTSTEQQSALTEIADKLEPIVGSDTAQRYIWWLAEQHADELIPRDVGRAIEAVARAVANAHTEGGAQ